MANINETTADASSMKAELKTGLRTLSGEQTITFIKYNRTVLPLDGYIFWVKDAVAAPLVVQGSLHYDTDQQQRADETIGINSVIFTTQVAVAAFNDISNNSAYIGSIDNIRFAFTSMKRRYAQAGTFHYVGDAIYPVMSPLVSDSAPDLTHPIATNSLPIWIGLTKFMPIYPAFLVPSNLTTPYAAVEIKDTKAWQAAPYLGKDSSHYQLVTEKCRVIMYGLRNDAVMDFLDYVIDYTLSTDAMGIQNMPAPVDVERGQSELGTLAAKKEITFEVNYYQSRVQAIARQLILNANIEFAPDPWAILDQNFQLSVNFVA